MATTIIGIILPIIFKIAEFFLDRAKVKRETLERFFEFVKLAGNDMGSAKLMKYGDEQLKWLKENPWQESK